MSATNTTLISPEELFIESKRIGATSVEQGIYLVKEALVLSQKQSKHELEFDLLLCIAKSCRFQGKGFESLEYCHKANRVLNKWFPTNKIKRSHLYREFGTLHSNFFNDHVSGLEYSLKSLSMNNPELIGVLNNNIGTTYSHLGQFEKALPYLIEAKAYFAKKNDQHTLPYLDATFAEYYQLQGRIPEAIDSYKNGIHNAKKAYETIPNLHSLSYIHSYNILGLAGLYLKTSEYALLTKQLEDVYEISIKFSLPGVQSEAMILEGKMYLALNEEAFFKELFVRAINFCEKKNMFDALDFWYKEMIELCESKDKLKEALFISKALIKNKEQKALKTDSINIVAVLKDKEIEIMELENQKREIEVQRDQLEQIAYVVAHDLKTPLHNISHFISLFLRKIDPKLPSTQKFYLDFAVDNSKKLHAMLDELLIYFSINRIKSLSLTSNLNLMIPKIIDDNIELITTKEASLSYSKLPNVKMHPKHLRIILSRMIDNSLKFSRNEIPPKIKIEVRELKNEHRIRIIDNGIGLESEYKHQIFDLFKQLDKNNYSGVGMSLAICKKIIALYGGTINVDTNISEGTAFEFNIPK